MGALNRRHLPSLDGVAEQVAISCQRVPIHPLGNRGGRLTDPAVVIRKLLLLQAMPPCSLLLVYALVVGSGAVFDEAKR
ncbi:hypothetical protein [Nocardia arthritidis]|uniref:Uncharacterized protein n=1 Tax=Nocardia arthritidis TaxID=228602 RepID=A0A6G9YKY4_9NOCA|nr:hypothetical protein [Nocardia arthritidis]QIS13929.1 hypothetical protein F5544_30425 [Nocardia arthritidis]